MIRNCVVHNEVSAEWRCTECGNHFCDGCIRHSNIQGVEVQICTQCGGRCVAAGVAIIQARKLGEREFWRRLPRIFAYPVRSGGLYILIVGTVFFVVTEFIATFFFFAFVAGAILAGLMCKYYVKVIRKSATGAEMTPSWGEIEFTDLEDYVVSFIRTAIVFVFCGAAPVLYFIFVSKGTPDWIFFTFVAVGVLYFPTALLGVLYYEDVFELNPITVVRAIFRVPIRYFVVALIFFISIALGWALLSGVALIGIPILGIFIHRFVSLYFYTMVMHLLGMFLYTNKERLGWD